MAKGTSPYSTGVANKIDFDLDPTQQMKQFKKEEKDAQAPNTLPYEMGQLPQYFGNMVDNGWQAARTLDALLKSDNIGDKEDLEKLRNNLEKMIVYLVKNVDPILSKFTIGKNLEDSGEKD